MKYSDVISTINNLTMNGEVTVFFRAFRQDPIVWKAFLEFCADEQKISRFQQSGVRLNPGSLALFTIKPPAIETEIPNNKPDRELLERAFFKYEEYFQAPQPVDSFEQAAILAFALVEKRRITANWRSILAEIVSRMDSTSPEVFERFWGSIFGITVNLATDMEDFLNDLGSMPQPETFLSTYTHALFCLPVEDAYRISAIRTSLSAQRPATQVKALHRLLQVAGRDFAGAVARELLENIKTWNVDYEPPEVFWDNPEASTQYAISCQYAAEIADFADDSSLALRFSRKAIEILTGLSMISKLKQQSVITTTPGEIPVIDFGKEAETMEPRSPVAMREFIYNGVVEPKTLASAGEGEPVRVITESLKMVAAGNPELGGPELKRVINSLGDDEIEQKILVGPRFGKNWDPINVLSVLNETGNHEEAERVAKLLLRKKPADMKANLIAAKSFQEQNKFEQALRIWETIESLDPESAEIKRATAKAYKRCGYYEQAFERMMDLGKSPDQVSSDDQVELGELALMLNKNDKAIEIARGLLERNLEDPAGLTITGIAYNNLGDDEKAVEYLQRATESGSGDARPWILLSDITWKTGDTEKSIKTLREGMAALPSHTELEFALAKKLYASDHFSEAFPLLKQISDRADNELADELLIKTMQALGLEGVDLVLDELSSKRPANRFIRGELGKSLVEHRDYKTALSILRQLRDGEILEGEHALAYVEALVGIDYSHSLPVPAYTASESREAVAILEFFLRDQPINAKALLLLAELKDRAGQTAQAFEHFARALDIVQSSKGDFVSMIQAGLARSAVKIRKNEVAMAAIQEALRLHPEWIGLQQLKAEVLAKIGEIDSAISQGRYVLELQPESISTAVWYIGLLEKADRIIDVASFLKKAIEKYPQSIQLRQVSIEFGLKGLNPELMSKDLDVIKGLLDDASYDELTKCGSIFIEVGDLQAALDCFTKACVLDPFYGSVNLAGYHREYGEVDKSLEVLTSLGGESELIQILKSEVLFAMGRKSEAIQLLPQASVGADLDLNKISFIPRSWSHLLESEHPGEHLKVLYGLMDGNTQEAFRNAVEWYAHDKTDLEAGIFAIECALATGENEEYRSLLEESSCEKPSKFHNHFALLRKEWELDCQEDPQYNQYDAIHGAEIESDLSLQALVTRQLTRNGDRIQSEYLFEKSFLSLESLDLVHPAVRIGLLRNMLKSAFALDRWKEALELCEKAAIYVKANHALDLLSLKAFVLAVEFKNRTADLDVRQHQAWETIDSDSLKVRLSQLEQILGYIHPAITSRWFLRARLAIESNEENLRALAGINPEPEDTAALMTALRDNNQNSTAIQAAKKHAHHPAIMFELAKCLEGLDNQEAIKVLSNSLDFFPNQPLVYRMLAKLHEKAGNLELASRNVESALDFWPNETRWRVHAAKIFSSVGNLEKPVEHLKAAIEIESQNPEILSMLGLAYLSINEVDLALEALHEASRRDPNRSDIWQITSDAYFLAGEKEKSLEAAEKASEVDPFAVKPHIQSGKVHWSRGELEKAIDQARLAVELDPEDAESQVFYARLLKAKGENTAALEALEKASRSKTASVQTVLEHATVMKEINGLAAARDLLEDMAERFPQNPQILKMLAEAQQENGNLREAELTAKKALQFHPEEPQLHTFLGRLQEKNGNLDQAALYFSQAIARNPQDPEGYLSLSSTLVRQREFIKARQVLERGIEDSQKDVRLYLACAGLMKDAKDYQNAEKVLRRAAGLDPQNLTIRRQLGAVLALNLVHQSQEVSTRS